MKKMRFSGIIMMAMVIIFSMTSCQNGILGANDSTLTVNGLSERATVTVYTNANPTSQGSFLSATAPQNFRARGSGNSPFTLVDSRDRPFTETGTFLVVVQVGNDYNMRYRSGVSFRNGSATINLSNMNSMSALPLL